LVARAAERRKNAYVKCPSRERNLREKGGEVRRSVVQFECEEREGRKWGGGVVGAVGLGFPATISPVRNWSLEREGEIEADEVRKWRGKRGRLRPGWFGSEIPPTIWVGGGGGSLSGSATGRGGIVLQISGGLPERSRGRQR